MDQNPVDYTTEDDSGEYLVKIRLNPEQGRAPAAQVPEVGAAPTQAASKVQTHQVLITGFALIIAIGTLLLKLPAASASGVSIGWLEAVFTATSAVTVTGLGVLTTATDFTRFGQVIILILLQVGGVGFIAFSVLLFHLVGRRVTLNERFVIQQSLAAGVLRRVGPFAKVANLALYILAVTLFIETIGTILLWLRWRTAFPDGEALWLALFHSVSSYCNAGFDLFSGTDSPSLFGFNTDYYSLFVMSVLILLGGFGVAVLYDLATFFKNRMLALNTRITLGLTVVLTLSGLAVMLLDRQIYSVILAGQSFGEQLAVSTFMILSARTAGLTILPLDELSQSTQLMLMIWMFIGGAPASMAGGVTSSTIGVLLITALTTVKGDDEAVAFGRTIPRETINKAVAIMTVSTLLVAVITIVLSTSPHQGDIFALGFEVVSAFANAGYSLNVTANLDNWGRALIVFTMFWGRLGPLTIVVALAQREQPTLLHHPEESVLLG